VVGSVLLLAALVGLDFAPRLYLLLGIGAAGLLLLLLQQPGLGLVVLATLSFALPLEVGTGTEVRLTAPVFLIPLVTGAWLVDGLRRGKIRLPRSRTVPPLLLLLLSGLISLAAGRIYWDPLVPQQDNLLLVQLAQWSIFALSAAVYLLAADLGTRGRWLEWATWAFLLIGSVVVLEFYMRPLQQLLGMSGRAHRSLFWVWLGALAAGQLLFNRRLKTGVRLWLLALILAAGYILWFRFNTWSSGWVPYTAAVLAVLWLRVWRRQRSAGLLLALVLILLVVAFFPLLFEHAGGELEYQRSLGGRLVLYEATLDLVKEHPILGLGPAAYRQYGLTRWLYLGPGSALYLRANINSHNNYIDIYAHMGLVGLGLFLWFLAAVSRLGWRLAPRFHWDFYEGYVQGALAGLAATLGAMMLLDWFLPHIYNVGFQGFRTSVLAWMFLGGLVALEARLRRQQAEGDIDAT
jgi:O-antigen ligase